MVAEEFAWNLVQHNVNSVVRHWERYPPLQEGSVLDCLCFTLERILYAPVQVEIRSGELYLFAQAPTLGVPLLLEPPMLEEGTRDLLGMILRHSSDYFDVTATVGFRENSQLRSFRFNEAFESRLQRDVLAMNFVGSILMGCCHRNELYVACLMNLKAATGLLLAQKRREAEEELVRHMPRGVDHRSRTRGNRVVHELHRVLCMEDLQMLLVHKMWQLLHEEEERKQREAAANPPPPPFSTSPFLFSPSPSSMAMVRPSPSSLVRTSPAEQRYKTTEDRATRIRALNGSLHGPPKRVTPGEFFL